MAGVGRKEAKEAPLGKSLTTHIWRMSSWKEAEQSALGKEHREDRYAAEGTC